MFIAALMAGGLCCSFAAEAGKGYQGVIAPSSDDESSPPSRADNNDSTSVPVLTLTPSARGSTRNSIIAPAASDQAASNNNDDTDNDKKPPAMTPRPGTEIIHDLKYAAVLQPKPVKGPELNYATARHSLLNGRPAMEEVVNRDIKRIMDILNNKELPSKEREAEARKSYKSLSHFADGLRSKQQIPDDVYRRAGLSEKYITEEKSSVAISLEKLDNALAILKPYE